MSRHRSGGDGAGGQSAPKPAPRSSWQRIQQSVDQGSMSNPESVRTLLVESIGGWRGIVDSGLPVVVFVVANAVGGLAIGIWAAVACAAVIFALRLIRRDPVQQSISGLFAVGVAAFIAWRMGQARGFFLLGIWRNAIYGGVLLISVLLRWPLIGAAWEYLDGRGTAWRANRRLMRAYSAVTLVWVAVFAARVLVQRIFYVHNETGWLAGSSLAMGYPLMGVALLVTVLVVRRETKDLPKPSAEAAEPSHHQAADPDDPGEPPRRVAAEPDEPPRRLAAEPGPD